MEAVCVEYKASAGTNNGRRTGVARQMTKLNDKAEVLEGCLSKETAVPAL
jgi:hypothetical protein